MHSFFKIIFSFYLLFVFIFVGCDKNETQLPQQNTFETGSVADVKGKVYKTIKIGSQWWMAEDLAVDVYRDSSLIKKIDNNAQWSEDTSGAFVISNGNYYYNWFAVSHMKSIAPLGWHVPTDQEWKQLENYLGMQSSETDKSGWRGTFEGNKLKIGGPYATTIENQKWNNQLSIDGFDFINESGFSALPNNCRLFNGSYGEPIGRSQGFWWTTTEIANDAWFRNLDYKKTNILRSHVLKNYGFAVRCIKD
jgi:uncharacterized protein (TIGR02145 family)